ncbi:MAG: glycerate kinase [Proteobacteria bacterium]|nr:glycerate kinase [Pseudomonadota bacterium]
MTAENISVLVSMTPFKGSLSNLEACQSVSLALTELNIAHSILPIGDGGNGTGLSLHQSLGGEFITLNSFDPLGHAIEAPVLCFPNSKNPTCIYIESSSVCGHTLIKQNKKNALAASSFGLGDLLNQASTLWSLSLKEIWVGLGDSAVSDVGIGMLSALGVTFWDGSQNKLNASSENLIHISGFSLPKKDWSHLSFTILCDVSNSLCGPSGSAQIFSPQKGATPEEVDLIARGMENFASLIEIKTGRLIKNVPMTGSAGGLSTAFFGFLNAQLVPGCEFLFEKISFDSKLMAHSLVVTGEGKTDLQTLKRKAPSIVASHAKRLQKKCLLVSGSLEIERATLISELTLVGAYECGRDPSPTEALTKKTLEVFRDF